MPDPLTLANYDAGIKGDSFLTVIDEDDNNPRVNLVLNVQESYVYFLCPHFLR